MSTELNNLLATISPFVKEILLESGVMAKEFRKNGIDFELKADGTKVTKADLAIQQFVLDKLTSNYPDYRVTAEEILEGKYSSINHENLNSDFRWVIDPIDGTSMFANPKENFYGHALALMHKNDVIFAAFYSPEYELEQYKTNKWTGCYFEASELSNGIYLNETLVSIDKNRSNFQNGRVILDRVKPEDLNTSNFSLEYKSRSASLCLSLLAAGLNDSVVVFSNGDAAVWDVIPGNYLVRKSGGICVDINHNEIFPLKEGKEVFKLKGQIKRPVIEGEYFAGYPLAIKELLKKL